MKYSREYILSSAFDVFMEKGYDSASISVLQQELKMSRGAMYRYFKNKEELFTSVIDEYFFKPFYKIMRNMSVDHNMRAPELIEVTHRRQKVVLNSFAKAGVTHMLFLNYTALIIQAAKHYPDFVARFKRINNKLYLIWKKALLNSIEAGEVKKDVNIDIMANLFNNISIKESEDPDFDESTFTKKVVDDFYRRREALDYLYELIKV
ncbi:TetR/AcrR family transcriptional regulator [Dysgonomonas sp. 520]|uniref:TetR/AcrR family transcriptional regulator n=1 Tax=Dysgonomonas sp. 520 TaxID=2302931 RepID=UPI0013D43BCC|nr:TetR/AcrR family transcriptional regulator [Dysgonomonas sp. 520]NDW10557.1 TetR/AcrR family transcriptional regulator [Dysgonomonas sp. 520]